MQSSKIHARRRRIFNISPNNPPDVWLILSIIQEHDDKIFFSEES